MKETLNRRLIGFVLGAGFDIVLAILVLAALAWLLEKL